MKIGKKGLIFLAGIIGIVLATIPLLGEDNGVFLKWWLMLLVLGVGFLPLTGRVFGCFEDKGWLFSKAIGIAVSGFAVWALCSAGILKFTAGTSLVITILCVMICWGSCIFLTVRRKEKFLQKEWNLELVLGEEFLFLAVFFIWTYLAGFHPEAHGTEKFMDYGFMAAMMRSETLPAPDIWYALKDTNYYYGGQYYAVYLTKVSFSDVADTYNLMRTLVAALLGGMSFSIVYQLVMSVKAIEKKVVQKVSAVFGGILAVGAVVFSGNLHYLVYGVIGKALGWEKGLEYWFPNSTRYIGYCTRRSACTCSEYDVCDCNDWTDDRMDSENQEECCRRYEGKLEKMDCRSLCDSGRIFYRFVPIHKLLGFCNLFYGSFHLHRICESVPQVSRTAADKGGQ